MEAVCKFCGKPFSVGDRIGVINQTNYDLYKGTVTAVGYERIHAFMDDEAVRPRVAWSINLWSALHLSEVDLESNTVDVILARQAMERIVRRD